jgi:NADH dehydrogenase
MIILVIATGSKTNFFVTKRSSAIACLWKHIPQALNIRSFILENFEQAVLTTDVVDQNS